MKHCDGCHHSFAVDQLIYRDTLPLDPTYETEAAIWLCPQCDEKREAELA